MRIRAGYATDIGKVRDGNEDSFLAEHPLYAVADGMGGHLGGEVASHLALETLERLSEEGREDLSERIRRANDAVFERSVRDRNVSGMGTTLTAAVVAGDELHLAHVGDSRAYLLRAGDLRRLTEDHTLVARMVKAGEITQGEAEVHPHRNVLTRAVGTEPDVDVDESRVALLDGDRILLCTDGLTGMVPEQQLRAILESEPDPQQAAHRLVKAANRAGGVDNTTVVLLDVHGDDPSEDPARDARPGVPRALGSAARRYGLRAGMVVAIVAALLVALRVYADRQWYVGEHGGHVAVYQGIPATFGGFRFSHVSIDTDIDAAQAEALPLYADLASGITANNLQEAQAIVDQIRRDVRAGSQGQPAGISPSP
ncbi:MAG: Stp1/IreP family PP2C-type Ser/Thr phosphatase [Actinobacteria bacterium]|nr:Stp1/IreP family PP2C-type Ser/Thr phosphatase [Actinomycetota bacterium]